MIHPDINLKEYLAIRAVSKHTLDALCESPLHAWEQLNLPSGPPTEAMICGAVVDCLLCEPQKLETRFHIRPATYGDGSKKWNGNATECREWMAAHIDKPIVTADIMLDAEMVATAVRREPKAARLLEGGRAQVTITWKIDRFKHGELKGRPDIVGDRWAADIKTCRSANLDAISRTLATYRYHVQAAIYQDGLRANGYDCNDFYLIFVDKTSRPKVNVRLLAGRALDLGRMIYTQQLAELDACFASDKWPGYCGDPESPIGMVDLPDWSYGFGKLQLNIEGGTCIID